MGVEIIFFVIIFFVIIAYIITIYNGLISLRNNFKKAWANIDVSLKQRNDELPNLVEIVKGYTKHERKVLEEVTKARTQIMITKDIHKKAVADNQITNALKSIFAVAENYPKLKASDNFLKLQERISGIENQLADRRELYNDSVNNYNIRIQSVPDIILAKIFSFREEELFEAQESEKKNVDVSIK